MNDKILLEMMNAPARRPDRGRTRRMVTTAATFAFGVAGAVSLTTGALFSDNDAVAANEFTTGTVDITTTPATAVVSSANMAPGDVEYGNVTVANSGSLEYRYSATDIAVDTGKDLSTQLKLDVFDVASGDCNASAVAAASTKKLASKGPIATTREKLFGDAAQGSDVGDRVLAANTSEKLCVRVSLPLDTANSYQDTHTEISLRFDAEQTANNP